MERLQIDRQARERAEGWIGDLQRKLDEVDAALATLGGFVGERSLGAAVVGSMRNHNRASADQVATLREFVRDMDADRREAVAA